MFTQMDSSLYDSVRTKSRLNIFRDYLVFLEKMDSLSEDEKYLCSGRVRISLI